MGNQYEIHYRSSDANTEISFVTEINDTAILHRN